MLIEQIIKFQLRGPGLLGLHVLLWLVIFMTNKILWKKSLSGLLFTAKILQEAMCLTSPFMHQITYN